MKQVNKMSYFLIGLRVVVGCVFIVSGIEKAMNSVENTMYVVQSYEILHNAFLEKLVAFCLPWAELVFGVFLIIGLWTRLGALALMGLSAVFLIAVSQSMIRGLSLKDCGCFGDLVHFPLYVTLIIDCLLVIFSGLIVWRADLASKFSLERLLEKKFKK